MISFLCDGLRLLKWGKWEFLRFRVITTLYSDGCIKHRENLPVYKWVKLKETKL